MRVDFEVTNASTPTHRRQNNYLYVRVDFEVTNASNPTHRRQNNYLYVRVDFEVTNASNPTYRTQNNSQKLKKRKNSPQKKKDPGANTPRKIRHQLYIHRNIQVLIGGRDSNSLRSIQCWVI